MLTPAICLAELRSNYHHLQLSLCIIYVTKGIFNVNGYCGKLTQDQ